MKLKYLTSLTLMVALGASAVVAELAALGSTARGWHQPDRQNAGRSDF